jgi:hypothetical protein
MSPALALQLLKNVSSEKITVAKEVIRLIGELRTDEAFAELLLLDAKELKRDVRIALLRAFWDYLEREQTWQVFDKYRTTPEPAIALHLVRIPADRLTDRSQGKLVSLLASLMSVEDSRVKLAVLERCSSMPVFDANKELYPGLVRELESPVELGHSTAASALLRTYATRDGEMVGAAVAQVLKKRKALSTLIYALEVFTRSAGSKSLPAARAALVELGKDPCTVSLQLRLAATVLPWEEFITLIRQTHDQERLHAGALETVVQAILAAAGRADADLLQIVEDHFAKDESDALRKISLAALLGLSGGSRGWSPERISRLEKFRNDPSALVAERAQFTFPQTEAMYAMKS